ncbi:hypothetical protein BU23DRAFT_582286 [Bimuria novae-zelandiae CBS 107.79]|uniref:Uncharacterized protein n=1 Tax=Bimuria novae-zelandiae CBS 107.79 TaxID=1447943 RepID=A0A6A5UYF1_9PLEO|nr:hypothetical protein BU23DRAFT_582286 [Bimuria novae-zelandiae CBS 107.79]
MPSNRRREDQHQEQSAYQATTIRHHATRSASANQPPVPFISTTVELNKPLPPSPEAHKKKHKPLLNLIKKSSGNLDSSRLQPEPLNAHRRSSSNGNLSPEPSANYYQSRSMPASPLQYSPPHPSDMQRAHSTVGHYADVPQYQAYSPRPQVSEQQRAVSMETYFDPSPVRPRRGSTFPESTVPSSTTARESVSGAPRPHTWVSPTDAFGDATDFHLFAEATAGLPGGFDPLSPTETPRLQGSLFARGTQNDRIPVLARNTSTQSVPVTEVPLYDWVPQQAPRDYSVSSSALPQTSSSALPRRDSYDINALSFTHMPNLNAINLELERLGLSDNERPPDDELPDYAQSQAEMAALRRKEASARARELESRWNLARGRRNR